MESNWRWNVAVEGMRYLGFNLLARYLPVPGWWVSNTKTGFDTAQFWTATSDPDLTLQPLFTVPKAIPFSNFPYGFTVEPDH